MVRPQMTERSAAGAVDGDRTQPSFSASTPPEVASTSVRPAEASEEKQRVLGRVKPGEHRPER